MTKHKAGTEKQHNVVELQRIMNFDNVARHDLDATVDDHVLQHKHVHTIFTVRLDRKSVVQ